MMALVLVVWAIAAGLAWRIAARRPEHRPVAVLLTVGIVGNALAMAWTILVLAPIAKTLGISAAWTGGARVAALAGTALALLWPSALLGAAIVVFARGSAWAGAVAGAVALVAIALVHPTPGSGTEERMMEAVRASATLAGVVLGLVAWYRGSATAGAERTALGIVLATELVAFVGLWRGWPLAQLAYVLLFVALLVVEAMQVRAARPAPASP